MPEEGNGMTDKTTAVTALRALQAAEKLQDALAELGRLYGVSPHFHVGLGHIGFGVDVENSPGRFSEALMQDLADIAGADMQPEIDTDLWATWRGRGEHDGRRVHITLVVPPNGVEGR
jgi:hypothetical protein